MTTLMRVQEAARVASRRVDGPARAVFTAFIAALEGEIEKEYIGAVDVLPWTGPDR